MRQSLVIANWKMNASEQANRSLIQSFLSLWQGESDTVVAVCPPSIYIPQVAQLIAESSVKVGAQDVSEYDNGAYTGELSANMLSDNGCQYVLVGHSERREYHGESNSQVAAKTLKVLQAKMTPVVCVGETLEQRDSEQTLAVIGAQIDAVMAVVGVEQAIDLVVAYEPVWAIGTGRTATPEQAQQVHAFIRQRLAEVGDKVSILYGGSVKPGNAQQLFEQPDIDGALVGGASLVAKDFCDICAAAQSQ